ncbi:hypothetical protein BpHYR1_000181, partial [Brachionus plicatilis]
MKYITNLMFYLILNQAEQLSISNSDQCSEFHFFSKLISMNKIVTRMALNTLIVRDFNNFDQIKLECIQSVNDSVYQLKINLVPGRDLELTDGLQLQFHESVLRKNYFLVEMVFNNIKKIKINLKIFNYFKLNFLVKFDYSRLSLDMAETECSMENSHKFTTFQSLSSLSFARVKYDKDLCPLMFFNGTFSTVSFGSISESFVLQNVLNFKKMQTPFISLIENLYLDGHDINLNKNLLDLNIFKEIKYLLVTGNIKSIDWTLIKELKSLIYLSLDVYQTHLFFYQNYKYLEQLNKSLIKPIIIWMSNRDNYTFPDKDFCVFAKFPQLTHISIQTGFYQKWTCNCVLFWISGDCGPADEYTKCEYERWASNCQYFHIQAPIYNKDFNRIFKWHYLIVGAVFKYISSGGLMFVIVLLISNVDKLNASIAKVSSGFFDPDYYGFPMRNSFIHTEMAVFDKLYYYSNKKKVHNKYFFLFIINVVFNGFILWLILLASDLFLLVKFKFLMSQSQSIWSQMKDSGDLTKRHILSLKSKEMKTSARIWLNNFILLTFRLLELCGVLFIFIMVM